MLLTCSIKGVIPVAPTPFFADGKVDDASIDRMIDFFVASGVNGMTILGQLGEAPKLDHREAVAIVSRVIARTTLPVIVGVSAPGFAAMRSLTHEVMALGAAGVMIGPPNNASPAAAGTLIIRMRRSPRKSREGSGGYLGARSVTTGQLAWRTT